MSMSNGVMTTKLKFLAFTKQSTALPLTPSVGKSTLE